MKNNEEDIKLLQEEIEELEQRKEAIENNEEEVIQEYRDLIDETSEEVKIGNISFLPSRVLEELDPTAFNCGYDDYFDEELNNINNEIEEKKAEIEELKKGGVSDE